MSSHINQNNICIFTNILTFFAFPKLTINVNLKVISGEDIGSFGIGPRDFVQGTCLTNGEDVMNLPDPHLMPRPDDKEIRWCRTMMIQRGAEKAVF